MGIVGNIRRLCEQRGITLNQLEKATGIAGTIARWDDHSPSVDNVKKVASYLCVSTSELLGETVDDDEELMAILQTLRERSDMKMLFQAGMKTTPETVRSTAIFLEGLAKREKRD